MNAREARCFVCQDPHTLWECRPYSAILYLHIYNIALLILKPRLLRGGCRTRLHLHDRWPLISPERTVALAEGRRVRLREGAVVEAGLQQHVEEGAKRRLGSNPRLQLLEATLSSAEDVPAAAASKHGVLLRFQRSAAHGTVAGDRVQRLIDRRHRERRDGEEEDSPEQQVQQVPRGQHDQEGHTHEQARVAHHRTPQRLQGAPRRALVCPVLHGRQRHLRARRATLCRPRQSAGAVPREAVEAPRAAHQRRRAGAPEHEQQQRELWHCPRRWESPQGA
eukprot:scaffold143_cov260-Pinguiococcus_pyrenoidosus.AAC.47